MAGRMCGMVFFLMGCTHPTSGTTAENWPNEHMKRFGL